MDARLWARESAPAGWARPRPPAIVLLDSSYLIALERETRRREQGPARAFLPNPRGQRPRPQGGFAP
jgi:hypothetical protein